MTSENAGHPEQQASAPAQPDGVAPEARVSPRFVGSYPVTLDKRGRIVIPAEYRYALEAEVIMGPAPGAESLYVFPRPVWEALVDRLEQARNKGDPEARVFHALYTTLYRAETMQGSAHRVDISGEVTDQLKPEARFGAKVHVVGEGDRLRVLSEAKYLERRRSTLEEASTPEMLDSRWA